MSEQTIENWHVGLNPGPIVYDQNGNQIADCRTCANTTAKNKENARLIAAAPETKRQRDALLVALQIAATTLETVYRERDPKNIAAKCAAERARAAISLCEKEGA